MALSLCFLPVVSLTFSGTRSSNANAICALGDPYAPPKVPPKISALVDDKALVDDVNGSHYLRCLLHNCYREEPLVGPGQQSVTERKFGERPNLQFDLQDNIWNTLVDDTTTPDTFCGNTGFGSSTDEGSTAASGVSRQDYLAQNVDFESELFAIDPSFDTVLRRKRKEDLDNFRKSLQRQHVLQSLEDEDQTLFP